MPYIKLSYALEEDSPVYIGLKKPLITPNNQISKGDGYNTSIITVENHCGTHVDAPGHFIEGGKIISDYTPDELVFTNPMVLDLPKKQNGIIKLEEIFEIDLEGKDCIFFNTGFAKYRKKDPETYLTSNPGIEPELIYWLRRNHPEIRCIGIDCVSISSYSKPEQGKKAHLNAFKENKKLGKPLILIEDMDLEGIENLDSLEAVFVFPWDITVIDSAPCTVLAKIKN